MRCSLSRTPSVPVISKPTWRARRRAILSSSTTGYESSSPSAMTSLSPLPTVGGSTLTLRTLSVPGARCTIQPSDVTPLPGEPGCTDNSSDTTSGTTTW